MARAETNLTPGTHHSENPAYYPDSTPIPGSGTEPASSAIHRESVSHTSPRKDSRPKYFKEVFARQRWHKPYADALMEGDASKIPAAIAKAERAIFGRYLELRFSTFHAEETADLDRAIDALREIKGEAKPVSPFVGG